MKSLSAVEDYVRNLLLTNLGSNYTFHNLFHTTQVVEKAMELASEEKMGSIEVEVLLFAAWFHDTGYICGSRNHEETSCAIAAEFLSRLKADEILIEKVGRTILSTRMPQAPTNRLEAILCDADLHHLGSVEYKMWNNCLCTELKGTDAKIDEKNWLQQNITFFEDHHYWTPTAEKLWLPQKLVNPLDTIDRFYYPGRIITGSLPDNLVYRIQFCLYFRVRVSQ